MNTKLTQTEIDKIVVSQADNEEAWEKPIMVNRERAYFLTFPRTFEISSSEEILGGTPVFRGTNVPVVALLDSLENGTSLDEFLRDHPTVTREQAVKVLDLFRSSLSQLKAA